MSDIPSAKPGDIYVDKRGKLWRVVATCAEPTVEVEEIETDDAARGRKSGGVNGFMWHGFKRIWERPE